MPELQDPAADRFSRWKPLIDQARSEVQLLQVIREYCGAWLPSELAMLPDTCQQCMPSSIGEVVEMAVALKRADLWHEGSDDARVLMTEMARTFTYAAERLRVFHHPAARRTSE